MDTDQIPINPMTDDALAKRLLEIGKRIPSLAWWYGHNKTLGCSPREAVDTGRVSEVEQHLTANGW